MKGASVIPVKGDQKIVQELTRRLREALRDRLKRVIVYGSRARGDQRPGSDLDILVIVERLDTSLKQRVRQIRYQIMWEADFEPLVSLLCLEKAEQALEISRQLLEEDYLPDAISKAYFAMFYAANAALRTQDIVVSKHSAVIAEFGKAYAKTGLIDPKLHRALIDAFDERQEADYNVRYGT